MDAERLQGHPRPAPQAADELLRPPHLSGTRARHGARTPSPRSGSAATAISAPTARSRRAIPSSYSEHGPRQLGLRGEKTTGDFHLGAGLLFERDDFGNDVMDGFSPEPANAEDSQRGLRPRGRRPEGRLHPGPAPRRQDLRRDGDGADRPRTSSRSGSGRPAANPKDPAVVKDLYKAMFRRIAAAYPVDYYWFWTNEGWTWDDVSPRQIKATVHGPATWPSPRPEGDGPVRAGHLRLGPRPAVEPDALRPASCRRTWP